MMDPLGCLPRLKELFEILDAKLSEINCAINNSADPDTDGLFDQSEYYVGIGLVAAQQYLGEVAAFSRIGQDKAYKLGPRHRSGIPYAKAINSAANFWKHEAEWWEDLDRMKDSNSKTKAHVGVIADSEHYQLSNFLFALSNNKEIKLKCMIPIITEWLSELSS